MQEKLTTQPSEQHEKILYQSRVIIYVLMGIATAVIFLEKKAPAAFYVVLLFVLVVPHIEFLLSRKIAFYRDSKFFSYIIPSIFFPFFWGYTEYSLLYGTQLFVIISVALITLGGVSMLLKSLLLWAPSAFFGGFLNNFGFSVEVNVVTAYTCCVTLFLFLMFFSLNMNRNLSYLREIRRSLNLAKEKIGRVNKIITAASSSLSIESIMLVLMDALNDNRLYECVGFVALDRDSNQFYLYGVYTHGDSAEELNYREKVTTFLSQDEFFISKLLVKKEMTCFSRYTKEESDWEIYTNLEKASVFQTLFSIPLIVENKVIGIITNYSKNIEKPFSEDELQPIRQYIPQIAAIINNTLLHQSIKVKTEMAEKQQQEYEKISEVLSKYLSPQIYNNIFADERQVDIASSRKYLTVFFSELVGFTVFSENLGHEKMALLLNSYLDEVSKVALEFGGTIDKYIADNVLVFFGDPLSKGAHEDAVASIYMAMAMHKKINEMQAMWYMQGITELKLRVGINSGHCNVGNFGSEDHMQYTIIGKQVNLASRVQYLANPGEIIVSESTYLLIKDDFECEDRGLAQVKGIAEVVKSYNVLGPKKTKNTD